MEIKTNSINPVKAYSAETKAHLAETKSYLSVLYDSVVEVEVSGLVRFLCYNSDDKQQENEYIGNFINDPQKYYDCFYYNEFVICDENGQALNRFTGNDDWYLAIHVTKVNDGQVLNIIAEDDTGIHVTNLIDINFNYSPALRKEKSEYPEVTLESDSCDEVDWDDILSDDDNDDKTNETWNSLNSTEKQLVYSGKLNSLSNSDYQDFEIDSIIPLTDSGNILDLYLLKSGESKSNYYEDGTFYHRIIKIKPDGWEDLYISIEKETKLVMNSQSYISDKKVLPSDNVVKTIIFTSSNYYIHVDNTTGELLGCGYVTNIPAFLQLLRPYVYGMDNKTGKFKINRYDAFGFIDENRSTIKYAGEKFRAALAPYSGYMIYKDFGLYALQDAVEAGDVYTECKEIIDSNGNYVKLTSDVNTSFGMEDIDSTLITGRSLLIDDKFIIYDGKGIYVMKVIHNKANGINKESGIELKLLADIELNDIEGIDYEPYVYIDKNVVDSGDKTLYFYFGLKKYDNKVKVLKLSIDSDEIKTEFIDGKGLTRDSLETSDGKELESLKVLGRYIDFSSIGIQNEFSYVNTVSRGITEMHVHGMEKALDKYLDDEVE